MARKLEDKTIHTGMRLYDGTTFDTTVTGVAYGGFGVIAFGPNRLDRDETVAYKTLRRELLDDAATRASFVRECLLWVGIWPHPNITSVYAVLELGDERGQRPFIVLHYAENGSLRELLRAAGNGPAGRLPLDLALNLAQQIAAGLVYLHTPDPTYLRNEATVHRDLKPENVLLMGDGRAVITDFGLAKIIEDASAETLATLVALLGGAGPATGALDREAATTTTGLHTAAGVAMGTAAYMPPEQWRDAREAGPPADVYAFGVMLSELLAGRHALLDLERPHTQDEWRAAHARPAPRLLRSVDDTIPMEVETLYLRCLAAEPGARPTAAEALAFLQAGARALGVRVYDPPEMVAHTAYNEYVRWHKWAIACRSFERYEEALARSDRALPLARQLAPDHLTILPGALNARGNILKGLGAQAARHGDQAAAARWDEQAEAAFQEALNAYPPETTEVGREGRAMIWHGIGSFRNERERWAQAEDAYARGLALKPDMADTYYNRAKNLAQWGLSEAAEEHWQEAIAHLRQARVAAITSVGMRFPPAAQLLERIEEALKTLGVS